jgi:ATP-binding cassette subfamily B protein
VSPHHRTVQLRVGVRWGAVNRLSRLLVSAVTLVWRADPRRALVTTSVQTVTSLSLFVQVLLVKQVLDAVLAINRSGVGVRAAVLPVLGLAALTAFTSISGAYASLQQRLLGEQVTREVWRRILDVNDSVPLSAYESPTFYDQAQRVQLNAVERTQVVVQALVITLGGVLGVLAGSVAVLALAPTVLPLLLLAGVPTYITSRLAGRLEFGFAVAQTPAVRERRYLQNILTRREEAQEVRAYDLPATLRGRWEASYAGYLTDFERHVRRRTRLGVGGATASAALTALTLMLVLLLVGRGSLGVASAGAALVAVRLLGDRVGSTVLGLGSIYESSLFLADLTAHLARQPPPSGRGSQPEAPATTGTITLSDVSFTYPASNAPALRNVSMTLEPGQVVALVGENGSGKTTLAKILAHLYEPDSGQVRWGGVDVRSYRTDSVRRRIAVIFQDFVTYKLTARDNIGLGRTDDDATDQQVREAAVRAGADAFLSALPLGYGTLLTTEFSAGTNLSLGQWQRVALARALVRDAPLVILDEPSASLDARAEHALFQSLREVFAGRTVLVISHRFATVRTADRIVVLARGRVVEQGTHEALMNEKGLYAELFSLQASAYIGRRSHVDQVDIPQNE